MFSQLQNLGCPGLPDKGTRLSFFLFLLLLVPGVNQGRVTLAGEETPAPAATPAPEATPAPATTPTPEATPASEATPAPEANPAPEKPSDPEDAGILVQDRIKIIAEAKETVESTDAVVKDRLPGSVSPFFSYHFLDIALWRYVLSLLGIVLLFFFWLNVSRRFQRWRDYDSRDWQSWQRILHVARLGLNKPIKLALAGVGIKIVSWLIVTSYYPELVFLSDMIIYLAFMLYLYGMVGLVDEFYGNSLFHSPDRLLDTVRPLAFKTLRLLVLIITGVHIYQSATGETVVSIIAGLGIGGLALALASQETLKNLLGFASIAFDQPFLVGDSITIGDCNGTVEHIGMRSMRVRSRDGADIIIPNSNAISSTVYNLSRRPFILRSSKIYLHPYIGPTKLELALDLIRQALAGHQGSIPDKPPVVSFTDFESGRLVVSISFWVDPKSGVDFMGEVDRINRDIYHRLNKAEIHFS
ncbi:MAG: mechanosensitive ion channel family protein [Planctomycetota bacterium]|jgi:MscS family membrane protein|nr:mechanosensitive ion channel family protein [Planctomycetota bacterium]